VTQLLGGPFVWLPTVFNISVQITTQQTPAALDSFNLTAFTNGTLSKNNNSLFNFSGGSGSSLFNNPFSNASQTAGGGWV
jgi:hypothetical protein